MRGQVLKREGVDGAGLILGDDGRRYTYSQSQVRGDTALTEGAAVDFIDLGDEARDIYPIPEKPVRTPPAAPAPAQTSHATSPAGTGGLVIPADGLWTYFIRSLTRNYATFTGRARRSEYWGYHLFLLLSYIVTLAIDFAVSLLFFGVTETGDPNFIPVLTLLLMLGTILPSLAIIVRRLHDLDMSGWLYLLNLIPYVGGLILFVFTVLDSKRPPNAHGPSPKYGHVTTADTFA